MQNTAFDSLLNLLSCVIFGFDMYNRSNAKPPKEVRAKNLTLLNIPSWANPVWTIKYWS